MRGGRWWADSGDGGFQLFLFLFSCLFFSPKPHRFFFRRFLTRPELHLHVHVHECFRLPFCVSKYASLWACGRVALCLTCLLVSFLDSLISFLFLSISLPLCGCVHHILKGRCNAAKGRTGKRFTSSTIRSGDAGPRVAKSAAETKEEKRNSRWTSSEPRWCGNVPDLCGRVIACRVASLCGAFRRGLFGVLHVGRRHAPSGIILAGKGTCRRREGHKERRLGYALSTLPLPHPFLSFQSAHLAPRLRGEDD